MAQLSTRNSLCYNRNPVDIADFKLKKAASSKVDDLHAHFEEEKNENETNNTKPKPQSLPVLLEEDSENVDEESRDFS